MSDRDPIRDLENFSLEGDPVHPLPASEVRRRGDRMRRRRTGALAVGAAAAVAVIVSSTVFATQNLNGADTGPPAIDPIETTSPPKTSESSAVRTTIPVGFPLLVGVENDSEGANPTVSPGEDGLASVSLCAREVWPPDFVDRLAGTDPALDYHYNRELLILPNGADATAALARIRDGLTACASETTTDGAIPDVEFELVHTSYDEDSGAAETVTWTDAFADGSIGTEVFQFVRVGNAIAGTAVSSEANKAGVADQVPMVTAASERLVEAMCIFAETPCEDDGSPTAGESFTFGPDEVLGGDLKIGMSLKEAKANGAEATDSSDPECVYISVPTEHTGGESGGGVQGYVRRGYGVSTLFTGDAAFKTPEGVGPMSKLSEWRAAYPDGTWDKATTTFTVIAPGRTDRKYTFRPQTEYAQSLMLSDPEYHCNG